MPTAFVLIPEIAHFLDVRFTYFIVDKKRNLSRKNKFLAFQSNNIFKVFFSAYFFTGY